jgi:hypothetical protein
MRIFYEYRPALARLGRPVLVSRDQLQDLTGFISVFGFPEESVKDILTNGTTSGLVTKKLYADTLYLDFDNNIEAENLAYRRLKDASIGFDKYNTGGRGHHFHIPITPCMGEGLVSRFKRRVAEQFPGADLSIYKSSGIFRLPGTYHTKNAGHKKTLVEHVDGQLMDIPEDDIGRLPRPIPKSAFGFDEEEINEALMRALFIPTGEGGRNTKIFVVACLGKESGMNQDEVEDMCRNYNSIMVSPPLPEHEVITCVRSAYAKFRK